jgi:hypothetical protein
MLFILYNKNELALPSPSIEKKIIENELDNKQEDKNAPSTKEKNKYIFNLGSNYTFKNFTFEEDYNNIDTSNKFKNVK